MKLKRCPICGGKAILKEFDKASYIGCTNCYVSITRNNSEDAIKDWNTRDKEEET